MECTSTTASVQVIAAIDLSHSCQPSSNRWAWDVTLQSSRGMGINTHTHTHTRTQIEESDNKLPKDLKTFLWVWSHQSHIPLLMNHHHCRKRQKGQNIWETRFFFLIYSFSPEKSSCFKQQSLDKNHSIKLYFNSSFKAGITNSRSWPIHLQACKFEFE